MTLKELSIKTGKSISTLQHSFPRTQKNLAKKGIYISKEGYGDKADYKIEYEEIEK